MKRLKQTLAAMLLLLLGGCAVSDFKDINILRTLGLQGDPKPNTFEVFFEVDAAEISEGAAVTLQEVADSVRNAAVSSIDISIHTAASGWNAHSQDLSERRAEAVKAELVKDGVRESAINNVEIGNDHLVPTSDGIREPQNRRTEIIVR